MSLIQYNIESDPTETGVYACRVPMGGSDFLLEDKFLMWMNGSWGYLRSDQSYRGDVLGWIGPLQRRLEEKEKAPVGAQVVELRQSQILHGRKG